MPVVRVVKNKNYSTISNEFYWDMELDLKAMGLLGRMLTLPENWEYTLEGLAKILSDGIDSIRSSMKKLESAGYVQRSRVRDSKGRLLGTEYIVFERKFGHGLENPTLGNPTLGNPTLGNPMQLNNYKQNIDIQSTDEITSNPLPSSVNSNEGINSKKEKSKKKKADQSDAFDRFWKAYPRKVSKARALKAWEKINPDAELAERIISAVAVAIANDQRFRTEQYTPHPATWLNGEEWENSYGSGNDAERTMQEECPGFDISASWAGLDDDVCGSRGA